MNAPAQLWLTRVGRLLLGLLLGAAVGLPALLWHSQWWGLILAGIATAATAALCPPWVRLGFVVGWWIPVLRGATPTGAGDLLLQADVAGYGLLIGGFVLAVGAMVATPVAPRGSRTPR